MAIFSWKAKQNTTKGEYKVSVCPAFGYQTAFLQGIGNREKQEDSYSFVNDHDVLKIHQNGLLAIVADGMGGMADGKKASTMATTSLLNSFDEFDMSKDISSQIHDAFYIANERVYNLLDGYGGSTAILCLIYHEKLWFASVGDSSLYMLRDQQLNRLNKRHTLCNDIMLKTIRRGSIDPSEGRNDPEAHALSSFLGMEQLSGVDYLLRPLGLEPGDVLLLCSDGIDGTLDEDMIISCLEQKTPEYCCFAIENEIKKKAKKYQDNYTGLIIRCVK